MAKRGADDAPARLVGKTTVKINSLVGAVERPNANVDDSRDNQVALILRSPDMPGEARQIRFAKPVARPRILPRLSMVSGPDHHVGSAGVYVDCIRGTPLPIRQTKTADEEERD
jgi:hypothetical protein